jgi:hypothetical protein
MTRRVLLVLCALLTIPLATAASDGKWTPQQVLEIDPAWLAAQGLELPPGRLWDEERGTGLLSGAVSITGCSAGFISATGLLATNHHCLFGLIQEHSTPERDLITHGFLARTSDRRAAVEDDSRDRAAAVHRRDRARRGRGGRRGDDSAARGRAIAAERRAIAAECEKTPDAGCRVAVFDEGVQYVLIETLELRDLRLVYAPPRRSASTAARSTTGRGRGTPATSPSRASTCRRRPLGRVRPPERAVPPRVLLPDRPRRRGARRLRDGARLSRHHLPPCSPRRWRERRDRFFPRREEVFGEWIRPSRPRRMTPPAHRRRRRPEDHRQPLQERPGADRRPRSRPHRRAAAGGRRRGGRVGGPTAGGRRRCSRRGTGCARTCASGSTWERDFLLSLVPVGLSTVPGSAGTFSKMLYHAVTTRTSPRARRSPAAARPGFADADVPRLKERSAREEKSTFLPSDREVFALYIERLLALPEASAWRRSSALSAAFAGPRRSARTWRRCTNGRRSRRPPSASGCSTSRRATLRARRDPLLEFGFAFDEDLRALRERQAEGRGTHVGVAPGLAACGDRARRKARRARRQRTLRVSFAHVQGYSPRDAVTFGPQTTLAGPWRSTRARSRSICPETVRAAAATARESRWADPRLGDVPIGFLADGDTTGGNSGSPVVNGRGELVGLNFDRVWENVANDFGFNPEIARNVSVDIRYMLWNLEEIERATELLAELGVAAEPATRE